MLSPKVYLASLVEAGYLDQIAADRLELESLQTGKEIETLVLSYNLAPKDALLEAKAKCLNVQSVNIEHTAVNPAAINLISKNLATHYNIVPFQVDLVNKVLKVATGDPLNLNLQNFLEQKTGYHVTLCLGYPQDIEKAIPSAYTQSLAPDVTLSHGSPLSILLAMRRSRSFAVGVPSRQTSRSWSSMRKTHSCHRPSSPSPILKHPRSPLS
jgi:hypothetical protein